MINVAELKNDVSALDIQLSSIFQQPSCHPIVTGRCGELDSIGVSTHRGGDRG